MLQILRHAPGCEHTVYVPAGVQALRSEVAKYAEVLPLSQLRSARPDVLHVHEQASRPLHDWLAAHRDVPALVTLHGLAEPLDFIHEYCTPVRTWDALDGALSIPNGIDFAAVEATGQVPVASKSTVVTCSRFAPEKSPMLFVETCAELARRSPGRFRYLFVGGSESEPLAGQTLAAWAELGNSEEVEWVPTCGHEEVLRRIAGASVFVLCSESETRPLVLMEAVALGVPAIAADVGGIATIEGLAQVLAPEAPAVEWADAIDAHLGRRAPHRPESSDGRMMALRYSWLYRGLLVERIRRGFSS